MPNVKPPIDMTPAERRMLLNLYSVVPIDDWGIWKPDYRNESIHMAFAMLARYFVEDAEFTDGELPNSFDSQIKGRVSQTLYVLYQCGMLD